MGIFLALPSGLVLAATNPDACRINPKDFADLEEITRKESDYVVQVREELALRRKLFLNTVSCAEFELNTLRSSLESIPAKDDSTRRIKENLINDLNRAGDYYTTEKNAAATAGIRGIQELSQDIRGWRASNYAPLAARAANLSLWFSNQNLFSSARVRLDQIRNNVRIWKIIQNEELQNIMDEASRNYAEADRLNGEAKTALDRGERADDVSSRIKSSLDALNQTYGSLLSLSDKIASLVSGGVKK